MNILKLFYPQLCERMKKRGPFFSFWSVQRTAIYSAPNLLLVLSGVVILVLDILLVFPEPFVQLDSYLKPFTNLLPFLSLMLACLTLIVAVFAYKSSVLRPLLTLQVTPLQQSSQEVSLPVDSDNAILPVRPLTQWSIRLGNEGEASAKYPMVRMNFEFHNYDGRYLKEDAFTGWQAISHAHTRGYYGFQWSSENIIIYPGFSVSLPTLSFYGKHFYGDFAVVFTYVADGVPATTLRIPVKVVKSDN